MFTGIIKKVSRVENVFQKNGSFFVEIKIPKGWKIKLGESISVNGVCSTAKKVSKNNFTVEYMPETVKKTTVGNFAKGREVNLERSLRLGDPIDGHIVQGHVDTTGKIIGVDKVKSSKVLKVEVPKEFMKFLAPKGSVSIDGTSLTIVDAKKDWFSVSLVSYTLENTNLGKIKVGEKVNIEVDALAKYIFNILKSNGYVKR
ncbi:MAG: riboflavin synthase [Candidatus Moranbacteria bacterium]|nr:riboflavin synthase [Candidatus Moranbacteria bacterium]